MKNLFLILSLIVGGYTASLAQCDAWWMGWSTPNFTATFVDSSATDPNVTTYLWDFGDGSTSTQQNPTHQYTTGGWYLVCLSIETQVNGSLCTDTNCDSLYVGQQPGSCQAYYTHNGTPNGNNIIGFLNGSQTTGGTTYYAWDFGDGATSTQASPTHTYSAPGTYTACLTVSVGSNGAILCTDQYCTTLTISANPPTCTAFFGHQSSGLNAFFNASGSNTLGFYWDFDDGSTGTGINPTHTYASGGTYNVCLTIVDSSTSCTDTYCDVVTVTGSNTTTCDASFNSSASAISNYQFFFEGSNPNGPVYSTHHWDFGDGNTDSSATTAHTYGSIGTFMVCHTVTQVNPNGTLICTDTYCDSVVVLPMQSCYASFTAAYNNNTFTGFQFTNYSSGAGNLTYAWDFGDGTTSSLASPSHTYTQSGNYTVCLTITDALGGAVNCTDTYCQTLQIGNNATFSLIGMVRSDSSSGAWSEAEVFLIRYDSINQTLTSIDTVITQNGIYEFTGVAQGSYLIKAALLPNYPAYNDFLPTYYQGVLFWYDAATVVVPNPAQTWYIIDLIPGNNPGGPGFIGGNVNQGANKQASGDPIEGVQVMLLNMDDSPVQYTITAADGSYSFDDVAYGTYKVYAEVLGKPTFPAIVTLSAQKETAEDVALVIEEEGVYSSITEVEVTYIDQTNFYPNPVSSTGTLTFNAKETGTVTIQVLNMLGQVVAQHETQIVPGNQAITLDVANHQAGLYLLSISFNNHVAAHLRFIRE